MAQQHVTLPPPPADLLAEIEGQLLSIEVRLRQHRVFPRTMATVELLGRLISNEQKHLRDNAESKQAKRDLEERLQAEKVDRCRAVIASYHGGRRA
jgi:hypothetical protein